MFTGIQNSHSVEIAGSIPSPVRTGYESVLAHRVDRKFAFVAKENGKVTEVSDKHLVVKYDSGKEDRVQLGSIYGVSTGTVIDNILITDYSIGQTVKQGDVVAYNPGHFARDYFNPSQVLFKNSTLARTVLMESNDTEEDSSAISTRLADAMNIKTTEVRNLVIPFEDTIEKLVIEGDSVEPDSILCTLVSAVFSDTTMFTEDVLSTLEQLATSSPKAKHSGIISHIDVMYYGDPDTATVSKSIKRLIREYDNKRRELADRLQDGRATTGRLLKSIGIDGSKVPLNHVIIKIFIQDTDNMGAGDKAVYGNQLKSVVARTMTGVNETESGLPIDAIFGYQSISNRIVQSAELIGTTNVLLKLITQEVIDAYRQVIPAKSSI